jgi:hypothetical protein
MALKKGKQIKCEQCGQMVYRKPSRLIKQKHQYCSYLCSVNAREKKCIKICECKKCGKKFTVKRTYIGKYCSKSCFYSDDKRTPVYFQTGYKYVLIPDKNKYVGEHRLVFEKYLGRPLTQKEVIHHINEVRDDNRIENLQLFPSSGKHTAFHRWGKIYT